MDKEQKSANDIKVQMHLLLRILDEANQAKDLDEFFDRVLNLTMKLLDSDGGGIFLLNDEKGLARVACMCNLSPGLFAMLDGSSIYEPPFSQVFIKGEPLLRSMAASESKYLIDDLGFSISIPLLAKGSVLGCLVLCQEIPRSILSVDVEMVKVIGQIIGDQVAYWNVTKSLTQLKAENEAVAIANADFLANMSHEIRSPISAITGIAQMLFNTMLNDEQRDYVSMIYSSGEALLAIINNVLDLSRFEANPMTLENIDFSLKYLLHDIMDIMEIRASKKNLAINSFVAPQVPDIITSDPICLRQVISNLINNAIKFTVKGAVVFSTSVIKDENEELVLRFDVIDTGIGMSPENTNRIFNVHSEFMGTQDLEAGGFGLAISKNLVEKMGGEIGCESKEGRGSTFWFTLPIPKRSVPKGEQPTQRTVVLESIAFNEHFRDLPPILVAEDSPALQKHYLEQLDKLGIPAELATNGIQVVQKYKTGNYSLIFMDCHMPKMDGYEATAVIRDLEKETGTHLPIIALTANGISTEREICLQVGMDDYLSKPVNVNEFIILLNKWLFSRNRGQEEDKVQQPGAISLHGRRKSSSKLEVLTPISEIQVITSVLGQDDPLFVQEIIKEYLEKADINIEQMENNLLKGDTQGIASVAAVFRPDSSYLGAKRLANILSEVEELGQTNNAEGLTKVMPTFFNEYTRVKAELLEILQGIESK